MSRRTREAQGRNREVGSGGSVEQNCELMNKKQMRGGVVWTSEHLIAKSSITKRQLRRSDSCAVKDTYLTLGGLCHCRQTEMIVRSSIGAQESADGVVGGNANSNNWNTINKWHITKGLNVWKQIKDSTL